MDLLAHGVYAATVCSRTGLSGGLKGHPGRWYQDPTVWWAALFGLLPDILSMWVPFAVHVVAGPEGNFFHLYSGAWLVVYRLVHSLLPAATISALCCVYRRWLFVPSLAWGVHVLLDAVSHGEGKFKTLLFYPFSSWGIDAIDWWRTRWFFIGYWALVPLIWLGLMLCRRALARNSE